MGRQVRKINPYSGHYGHLIHNHYVHRMYRWQSCKQNKSLIFSIIYYWTDNSHPTMTTGKPFKTLDGKRIPIGILSTPDILKFHVPIKYSFVPVDDSHTVDKKTGKFIEENKQIQKNSLVSSGLYKLSSECQKTVMNFNRCLKNVGGDACEYYNNYLSVNCVKN